MRDRLTRLTGSGAEVGFVAQVSESAVDNLVEAGEFQALFSSGSRPRTFDLLGAALTVSLYKAFKNILAPLPASR